MRPLLFPFFRRRGADRGLLCGYRGKENKRGGGGSDGRSASYGAISNLKPSIQSQSLRLNFWHWLSISLNYILTSGPGRAGSTVVQRCCCFQVQRLCGAEAGPPHAWLGWWSSRLWSLSSRVTAIAIRGNFTRVIIISQAPGAPLINRIENLIDNQYYRRGSKERLVTCGDPLKQSSAPSIVDL